MSPSAANSPAARGTTSALTGVQSYRTHVTPSVRGGGDMRVRVTSLTPHAMRVTFSLHVTVRHKTRILLEAGPCTKNGCLDSNTAYVPVRFAAGSVSAVRRATVRRARAGGVYCVSVQAYDTGPTGAKIIGALVPSKRACPRGRS